MLCYSMLCYAVLGDRDDGHRAARGALQAAAGGGGEAAHGRRERGADPPRPLTIFLPPSSHAGESEDPIAALVEAAREEEAKEEAAREEAEKEEAAREEAAGAAA